MSEPIWLAIIASAQAIALALIVRRSTQKTVAAVNVAASDAAEKRETVRTVLANATVDNRVAMRDLVRVAKSTHVLVNSNMGEQLRLNAVVSRTLANLTGELEHVSAAELAEQNYADHQAKQAEADSAHGTHRGPVPT